MDYLIFGIGTLIFVTYMFFLLRMINNQHKIQKENEKQEKIKAVEKIIEDLKQ